MKKEIKNKDKFIAPAEGVKIYKPKKLPKKVKESYDSFSEFLSEKEEKFVASTMRWITIKDERDRNQHILIKKKDGTIVAGMGGEHKGEKLDTLFKDLKQEREKIAQRTERNIEDFDDEIKAFRKKIKPMSNTAIHEQCSLDKKVKLTEDEKQSIKDYTGSLYSSLNKFLREPDRLSIIYKDSPNKLKQLTDSYTQKSNTITNALKKYKTKKPMIVYRGVGSNVIEQYGDMLEVGNIFEEAGFVSTSSDRDVSESFSYDGGMLMEIHVPKGSRAASIDNLSNYKGKEWEVLVDKGAKFLIKEVNKNNRTMVVELLPHDE